MTLSSARRRPALTKLGAAATAVAMLFGALVAPPALAQKTAAANRLRGEPVTLNFVNADIEGVTRAMAAILRKQFVIDPRVKGTITLYSETPLTPNEAYLNYLSALRGLGFTVVDVDGIYKVLPEADAKLQAGTVSIGDASRRGDQVLTQVFRLQTTRTPTTWCAVLQAADQPEQHDQRQPRQQLARHHRLCRQPPAHRRRSSPRWTRPRAGDVEVIPIRYADRRPTWRRWCSA